MGFTELVMANLQKHVMHHATVQKSKLAAEPPAGRNSSLSGFSSHIGQRKLSSRCPGDLDMLEPALLKLLPSSRLLRHPPPVFIRHAFDHSLTIHEVWVMSSVPSSYSGSLLVTPPFDRSIIREI